MNSDSRIRQDVLDEIEFDPAVDANDIGVTVEHGIVTLVGHVPNYSQKRAVERIVGKVKGVRGIAQEIEVRPAPGTGTSDDEIAERAANILKWHAMLPDGPVKLRVENGWVTLTGTLNWNYQRDGAERALRNLMGVVGVTNLIQIVPPVTPKDVKSNILRALHRNAQLEASDITVKVDGPKVTLEGKVKVWNDRKAAEDAAWATPGVVTVEDKIAVR